MAAKRFVLWRTLPLLLGLASCAQSKPATPPPADRAQSSYQAFTAFGQIFEKIRADYYRPVEERTLILRAVAGLMKSEPQAAAANSAALTVQTARINAATRNDPYELLLAFGEAVTLLNAGKPGAQEAADVYQSIAYMVNGLDARSYYIPPGATTPETPAAPMRSALLGSVIYVAMPCMPADSPAQFRQALEIHHDAKGIIIDLRNSNGGRIDAVVSIASDLLPQRAQIAALKARHPEDDSHFVADGKAIARDTPIVVLINDRTAAASEILAAALQYNDRAILAGSTTQGAGTVQTVFPDVAGKLALTTALVVLPSGRRLIDGGVRPDVELWPASAAPPIPTAPRSQWQNLRREVMANAKPLAPQTRNSAPSLDPASDPAVQAAINILDLMSKPPNG
jgi:C-terminal processing protease CtpA/Prc